MATETIDHSTLSRLVEAGAVRGAHVVGQNGRWAVIVKYGTHERSLAAQRSRQVRLFKRLETLVAYLKGLGLENFEVDAANFDPDANKTHTRPDRAVALKRAYEAAAYDQWWFRPALMIPAPACLTRMPDAPLLTRKPPCVCVAVLLIDATGVAANGAGRPRCHHELHRRGQPGGGAGVG
jgi:hypothetical protein